MYRDLLKIEKDQYLFGQFFDKKYWECDSIGSWSYNSISDEVEKSKRILTLFEREQEALKNLNKEKERAIIGAIEVLKKHYRIADYSFNKFWEDECYSFNIIGFLGNYGAHCIREYTITNYDSWDEVTISYKNHEDYKFKIVYTDSTKETYLVEQCEGELLTEYYNYNEWRYKLEVDAYYNEQQKGDEKQCFTKN